MFKPVLLILSTLILLTSCGKKKDDPLSLEGYNKACLNGKINGQFLVKYSNGSHELVSASSNKDFFNKILSEENKNLLQKRNLEISGVDFNFKVNLQSTTSKGIPTRNANAGPRMINAPFLWNQGFYGQGISTALIDSGYDTTHSLLKNSIQINSFDLGNDEDANNLKGDQLGWDFINNKPLTSDLGTHGTAVGSIIAAAHSPSFQFSVAPGSKIIPIAALGPSKEGDTDASGDSNTVISSINYAISRKVDLINASWAGSTCSKFIRNKVQKATDAGIIFITSAGNENINLDSTPIFPGSFPFSLLVNVGALSIDFSKQEDSNYGRDVDFSVLGNKVIVAVPHGFLDTASGTSVATPFVTGGLALLKSAFPAAFPEALLSALEKSKNNKKIPDLKRAFFDLKNQ